MVVLEGNDKLSSMNNHYIHQDYLTPLPTTLDTKRSPLALLAQTCSQIGADTPLSKSMVSALEKSRKPTNETAMSPPTSTKEKRETTPVHLSTNSTTESKSVFRPYENNVLSKKVEQNPTLMKAQNSEDNKIDRINTYCDSTSPTINLSEGANVDEKESAKEKCTTKSISPVQKASQDPMKDTPFGSFKSGMLSTGVSPSLDENFSSFCCTSRFENANPAFRPPFPGASLNTHQQTSMFPIRDPATSLSPYINYPRQKTFCADDADVVLPACKDPYCTGCQYNLTNPLMNKTCPSGCTQCDHQKYRYAMAMSLFTPGPYQSPLAYTQFGHSQICNWIIGDTYCGKRFLTTDEFLQHIQTHASAADFATLVASTATPLLSSNIGSNAIFSSPLYRVGYTNSSMNPLPTSRFHPYGKPILPVSLPQYEYNVFNPTPLSYYSAYSLQGRNDATAVHL